MKRRWQKSVRFPDMTEVAALQAKLAALRKGEVPVEELYGLVHQFGDDNFVEAEHDVAALLSHPNEQIRSIAVRVLAFHWNMKKYRGEFIQLMLEDSDDWVRAFAAAGLGAVLSGSRDPEASRALIRTLRSADELPNVREGAYAALMEIWFPKTSEELLEDLRSNLRSARLEAQDWDKVSAGPREEMRGHVWLWKQEWELNVDWDLVARIEGAIEGSKSDFGGAV